MALPSLNSNTASVNTPVNDYTKSLASGISIAGPSQVLKSNSLTAPFGGSSSLGLGSVLSSAQNAALGVHPTPSGALAFNPQNAPAIGKSPVVPNAQITQPSAAQSLLQLVPDFSRTPNGGTLQTDSNGSPVAYSGPAGFKIDTSGPIPSNILSNDVGPYDIQNKLLQYQDYVNALAKAQGYSPDYINALQGTYGAQTRGAELSLNQAELNSNLYTGNNLPGDTINYAQGATAKAQAQNTLEQAANSIQQLGANQALNTAQLARTGNIAAASTQLQYSPVGMAGSNAINQYNSLQQQHPDANIPPYNPQLSPAQNQQIAQALVSQSGSYRAQFLQTYQTPGGGTGLFNKLGAGLLNQNPDGTLSLVSGAEAAMGNANASALGKLTSTYNELAPAYKAANDDFTYINQFMQKAGLNQQDIPVINQVQNAINAKALNPGAAAAFKSAIQSLRSNYANLLAARTGSVQGVNQEAQQLIPDNLTIKQLTQVQNALNANGQNILNATTDQISKLTSQIGGGQRTQTTQTSDATDPLGIL